MNLQSGVLGGWTVSLLGSFVEHLPEKDRCYRTPKYAYGQTLNCEVSSIISNFARQSSLLIWLLINPDAA